jgi:RimJ/RimL family protein N-acetyltransferase
MTPELTTKRLILKPLALADAEQIQALFPHWEIVRHLLNVVPWPYPPDGALIFIRDKALPAVERGEAWDWTLRLKSEPTQIVGGINVRKGEHKNRGFWLALPWHGRGLMTEAVEAVNDFWFDTLKFSVLRVSKSIENVASRRISVKTGMRLIATAEEDYVSGRFASESYEITAEEWRARRGR